MGVSSLPKTVTRHRRDCDLNPGLLRLSPARYNQSATTEPPILEKHAKSSPINSTHAKLYSLPTTW